MTRRLAAALVLAATLACRSATQTTIDDRLFFGQNIPAGGTVSQTDWQQFVESVITPRFPKGFTIWQGNGQWLDPRGTIVREAVYVLEVHHTSREDEKAIIEIANTYKKRFGQDAVMRVTSPSTMQFY